MAKPNLPASADFFKQLSKDYEQLRFMLRVQEAFTICAAIQDYDVEKQVLPYLIEQLEIFTFKIQQVKDKIERRMQESES